MITSHEFTEEDFLYLKEKIFKIAGIYLTEKKLELVRSRVQSFLRKSPLKSVDELKTEIENNNPIVIQQFINLLTTNKTDFFREPKHFNFIIQELIPLWKKIGKTEVNLWCAASSTGEEPYTIAMVLHHHLPKNIKFKILATDIDTNVLKKAQNGVYPISKILEIPDEYQAYIVRGTEKANGWFKIRDQIHSYITYKQHNLIDKDYPSDEIFDVIFCRNVLIYFERKTISQLMEKFHKSIQSDGFFFIGHSESIQGNQQLFETLRPAIFKKVNP